MESSDAFGPFILGSQFGTTLRQITDGRSSLKSWRLVSPSHPGWCKTAIGFKADQYCQSFRSASRSAFDRSEFQSPVFRAKSPPKRADGGWEVSTARRRAAVFASHVKTCGLAVRRGLSLVLHGNPGAQPSNSVDRRRRTSAAGPCSTKRTSRGEKALKRHLQPREA